MGFEVPRRVAVLTFDEEEYEEAEVRCAFDVPFAVFFEYQRLMSGRTDDAEELAAILRRWGDEVLESWNLTRGGLTVPADGAGMLSLPFTFGTALLRAWLKGVAAVPRPLSPALNGGATSPEGEE